MKAFGQFWKNENKKGIITEAASKEANNSIVKFHGVKFRWWLITRRKRNEKYPLVRVLVVGYPEGEVQ